METKQKVLNETEGIINQSISSQPKTREVGINVSLEDYDYCYKELYVVTNTKELSDRIKILEDCSDEDIDYNRIELLNNSFPTVNDHTIDDLIIIFVSSYITENELETRMTQKDGDEQIVIDAIIDTHSNNYSSVSIR